MSDAVSVDKTRISPNGEVELELREWLDSLGYVLASRSPDQVRDLLYQLHARAEAAGVSLPITAKTPNVDTIPRSPQRRPPVHTRACRPRDVRPRLP